MAPKKRRVIGTVLRSTRKVIKETVQVSLVERDVQDSQEDQNTTINNVDGLGSKEPLTHEEEREGTSYDEVVVGLEEIIGVAGDVLKKDHRVRVIPVGDEVVHEEVDADLDGQSVEILINEEQEQAGETVGEQGEVAVRDVDGREKSKQVGKGEPSKGEENIPSGFAREAVRESSEVTQEQEAEPETEQETEPPEPEHEVEQEQEAEEQERHPKIKRKGRPAKTVEGKEEDKVQERTRKRRRRSSRAAALAIGSTGFSYKRYVFRVLKQVHPEMRISSMAMTIINNLMNDVCEKITEEASKLSRYVQRVTLSSSEIQDAVKLVLPGELGRHAIAEGSKAVSNYVSYEGSKGTK